MCGGQKCMNYNAGDRTRTCNLWFRKQLLYPLSYRCITIIIPSFVNRVTTLGVLPLDLCALFVARLYSIGDERWYNCCNILISHHLHGSISLAVCSWDGFTG